MRQTMLRQAAAAAICACVLHGLSKPVNGADAAQKTVPKQQTAVDSVPYFIATGTKDTGFRPGDEQLAQWALDAWRRSAGPALKLAPAPEQEALVRLYWAASVGGQYGEMRPLVVGGKRGAAVYIRPDMNALGLQIAARAGADVLLRDSIVYLTCLHELGHAFGLEHTSDFRDIMYSFGYGGDIVEYFGRYRRELRSRDDIARVSGLSADDVMRMKTLYGR